MLDRLLYDTQNSNSIISELLKIKTNQEINLEFFRNYNYPKGEHYLFNLLRLLEYLKINIDQEENLELYEIFFEKFNAYESKFNIRRK